MCGLTIGRYTSPPRLATATIGPGDRLVGASASDDMVYVERAKVRVAVRHRMDCCLLMAAAPCSAQCPSQLGTVGRSVLGENERERESSAKSMADFASPTSQFVLQYNWETRAVDRTDEATPVTSTVRIPAVKLSGPQSRVPPAPTDERRALAIPAQIDASSAHLDSSPGTRRRQSATAYPVP